MNKSKAVTTKLSELTYHQKCHMAWRLDHNTGYGLGAIGALMRLQWGDMTVVEGFEKLDMTPHQAKIHARKVVNFEL